MTDRENKIVESVKPFALTGEERIAALMKTVGHVAEHKIPVDIVECVRFGGTPRPAAHLNAFRVSIRG